MNLAVVRRVAGGALAIAAVALSANASMAADEFVVNTYRGTWQNNPDVATLKDGSFVVVWDSFYTDGDYDFYYIAGQRFTRSGRRIGKELFIDDDLKGHSRHPAVAALDDGGFAVVWENSLGSILEETDVYTRSFDSDGSARGGTARVHTADRESQYGADITATRGGYLVTFTSYEGSAVTKWDEIYLQRFDSSGSRDGARVKANQHSRLDQQMARLATLTNGNVIAIWDTESSPDIPHDHVRGRIFEPSGEPVAAEFLVSDENADLSSAVDFSETSIAVAALPDGQFVATWAETVLHDDRDTTFEIRGQRFDERGRTIGREFIARTSSEGVPRHSEVVAFPNGDFVVAWDAPGRNFAFAEALARIFDRGGKARGTEFTINQFWNRSDQEYPALALSKGGTLFAVYESEFLDGDDDAIAGRFFTIRRGDQAINSASSGGERSHPRLTDTGALAADLQRAARNRRP